MGFADSRLSGGRMSAAAKPNEMIEIQPPREAVAETTLRQLEARTRGLSLDGQMVECIDLLQSPELAIDDLLRSVAEIREAGSGPGRSGSRRVELVTGAAPETDGGAEESAFFYPSRELFVRGDGCSFTCLATDLSFRECDSNGGPASSPPDAAASLIDYAAVTCESRPFPVLGFAQHLETESAYPILLRALSSLIELTRPRRFDVLDREVYRGLLGQAPAFDLALVLWDDDQTTDPRRPLCELTRDLAEVLKIALRAEPRFPPILNDIICLRMNNKRFDGRLRAVWRV